MSWCSIPRSMPIGRRSGKRSPPSVIVIPRPSRSRWCSRRIFWSPNPIVRVAFRLRCCTPSPAAICPRPISNAAPSPSPARGAMPSTSRAMPSMPGPAWPRRLAAALVMRPPASFTASRSMDRRRARCRWPVLRSISSPLPRMPAQACCACCCAKSAMVRACGRAKRAGAMWRSPAFRSAVLAQAMPPCRAQAIATCPSLKAGASTTALWAITCSMPQAAMATRTRLRQSMPCRWMGGRCSKSPLATGSPGLTGWVAMPSPSARREVMRWASRPCRSAQRHGSRTATCCPPPAKAKPAVRRSFSGLIRAAPTGHRASSACRCRAK